jgi:hypothetical protein
LAISRKAAVQDQSLDELETGDNGLKGPPNVIEGEANTEFIL